MIPRTQAQILYSMLNEEARFLPEGPRIVTFQGRSALAWVDIQTSIEAKSGIIFLRFWDTGEVRTFPQERRPGFLFPTNRENTLFIGREKEVGLLDLNTNTFHALASISDASDRTLLNDGEIVPGGKAILFGTKDFFFREAIAHLYLYTVDDQKLTVLQDQQLCSNGKVFAADSSGLVLYDIDTPKRNVVRYRVDLNTRELHFETVVLDLAKTEGFPDGMVDGGDGSVIIAFYNPDSVSEGKAIRYRLSDSQILEEWMVPGSPRVTCPLLAKVNSRVQLILTTATEGMPNEIRAKCPSAGDLFIAETSIQQLPTAEVVRIRNG
jgi:sugar lactone lactonase YvrE